MKLGTSTLGCPEWTLPEILTRVKAYGFDGVELRGIGPDVNLTQSPHFATPAAVAQTRRAFAEAGLAICSLDTSASFADPQKVAAGQHEARAVLHLADELGVPFIRVFGGDVPDGGSRADATRRLADNLRALGEYAQSAGEVTVLLETHDAFSTGAQAAEALALANHPRVAALWDLHHPYRQGEAPSDTYAALAPFVRMAHVKDSHPPNHYCLLGEGDVPIPEMLRLLHSGGFDGWMNLEWEKRWNPALLDPSVAFPQYAAALRALWSQL